MSNKAVKVLLIEDNPGDARLIQEMLAEVPDFPCHQEGYQVLTARNGLEGMSKAQSEEPDLIILDVMLPGMDGFEVCHRLRAEPQTAQIPILMISVKAQEVDKATGLKVGADDYVIKPAAPRELVSHVETLLARKGMAWSIIETAQQIIAQEKEHERR